MCWPKNLDSCGSNDKTANISASKRSQLTTWNRNTKAENQVEQQQRTFLDRNPHREGSVLNSSDPNQYRNVSQFLQALSRIAQSHTELQSLSL